MLCRHPVALIALFLAILANLTGCGRMKSRYAAPNAASQSSTPTILPLPTPKHIAPKQITPADLAKLHWIGGTWRGTGGGVPPFYERYKFANDSTLIVETLADETLSKVDDVSRFELKDGLFGHSSVDSGSVATALDDSSITFESYGMAQNSFRWQRESGNSWKAILNWNDKNGAPKERIYRMERWPAQKP